MSSMNRFSLTMTCSNSLFVSLEAFQIKEENSSLGEYSEGIECLEHHYFQPHHLQYNVISGAEWKILEATDNTALEELYCDENIEGLFKLNSAQAIER